MYSLISFLLLILVTAQEEDFLLDAMGDIDNFEQCTNSTSASPLCVSLVIDTSSILSLQNELGLSGDRLTVISLESLDGVPLLELPVTESSLTVGVSQMKYKVVLSGHLTTTSCEIGSLTYSPCIERAILGISTTQWEHTHVIYKGPSKASVSFSVSYLVTPFIANYHVWKYALEESYVTSLMLPSYDDSTWESTTSFPFSASSPYLYLRSTFSLQDSQRAQAVELQYRSTTPLSLFLNGVAVFSDIDKQSHDAPAFWSTSVFPATLLQEGVNTVVACVSTSLASYPEGTVPVFDLTLRVLDTTDYHSYSAVFSYDASLASLFDGDFSTVWETDVSANAPVTLTLAFGDRSTEDVSDVCLVSDGASSLPPILEVSVLSQDEVTETRELRRETVDYTEPTAVEGVRSYCWKTHLKHFGSSLRVTMKAEQSAHVRARELSFSVHSYRQYTPSFSFAIPDQTLYRPSDPFCLQPTVPAGVNVGYWSLFTPDYHALSLTSGVSINGASGELCVQEIDSSLNVFVISGFEAHGYEDLVITVVERMRDCVDATTNTTYAHGTEKREGECMSGYGGYTYRVCYNGVFGDIQYDHCFQLPPSNLQYDVESFYYVNTPITLTPTVTNLVELYAVSPSLPSGLVLNELSGVISGSVSENVTATVNVTAMSTAGSVSTTITLVIKYHGCEAVDGYGAVESGEESIKQNSCAEGYSGYTYRLCFNGVFGDIQYDHCTQLAPSDLSYDVESFYFVDTPIMLTPTVTNPVQSYSASPSLPEGLTLNESSGVISGSVSENVTVAVNVTASNGGGFVTAPLTIVIKYHGCEAVDGYGAVESGEVSIKQNSCMEGYSGYTYRVCFNGTFGEIQYDHCTPVVPSDLSYDVDPFYFVDTPIMLTPTVTNPVQSYSVSPSLPDGLVLNELSGVISGSVSENVTATVNVTAMSTAGSVSTTITLVIKYHGCEAVDGYEAVESGEVSVKQNSCAEGYNGYTYRVCFNGTFGEIQYDHCTPVVPSDLSYDIEPFYYVDTPIMLTPTVANPVDSFSVSPSLPEGLVLNGLSGVISGSVSENVTATVNVTATNTAGSVTASLTIVIKYHGCEAVDGYEAVESGEVSIKQNSCAEGYSGYTYRVCFNGTFGEIQYDHCSRLAPSDLSYNVESSYFVDTLITLTPTVTNLVESYSVSPSLPDGLTLNESSGIISGSVSENVTVAVTVTAMNTAGSTTAPLTIVIKYHGCEAVDGYEAVESGEVSIKQNSCAEGYSGYTYRLCFNGVFGDIQYDHCTQLAPSDLSYNVQSSYFVDTLITLTPTVTNPVESYSVSPSLPEGLALNESSGIIGGSVSENVTATVTVTALNSAGSTTASIILVIKYHGCEAVDGYEAVESGEESIKQNSCAEGYSGYTYRLCFNGVFGDIQYDHCTQLAPSNLHYNIESFYSVNTPITLTPTITNLVDSFSVSPSLPDGLTLNESNGIISGMVTKSCSGVFTVTASNAAGSCQFEFSLVFMYPDCQATEYYPSGNVGMSAEIDCSKWGRSGKRTIICSASERGVEWKVIDDKCFNLHLYILIIVVVVLIIVAALLIVLFSLKRKLVRGSVKIRDVYI